ncbi:MAG: large-conductance mechanosensitive channel protein MscL [Bacteroidetes bacterium]|nr:large-conductance mechanosensitive channel protein MscL [Bacteroidota bacterium]
MWKEFKAFALSGSLLDIAIGFVMGAAFGKVVSAFTDGIISPIIGQLFGGADFNAMKIVLTPAGKAPDGSDIAEVAIQYGAFITTIIDFLIVAFVMFLIVRGVNKMKKAEAASAPPATPADIVLLEEIRDLLKKR